MNYIKELLSPWLSASTVDRLTIILIGIILILIILFFSKKAISKRITDHQKRYKAKKVTGIFAYIMITLIVLFVYSDKLGDVGIAFGVVGAGIAFALSEVITSFAGWISIMFSNQIKVGQRVKIGELRGDIIDIQPLKTTIMEIGDWVDGDLYNGRITMISNSFIFKEPVQNYSADYPFLWDEINIPLRMESDFKLARKLFLDITEEICGEYAHISESKWIQMQDKYSIEKSQVTPLITLAFDENWITFTIRYVVDYTKRRTTKDVLYTRILEEINKHPNIIMIATVTMEVTNIMENDEQG